MGYNGFFLVMRKNPFSYFMKNDLGRFKSFCLSQTRTGENERFAIFKVVV